MFFFPSAFQVKFQAGEVGPREPDEVQQVQVQGAAPESGKSQI